MLVSLLALWFALLVLPHIPARRWLERALVDAPDSPRNGAAIRVRAD
ncbi:hypothetical protein KY084_06980 [Stakelama sp. CBK3Z-3]|uniref:Uncharacterized protein n=1 Tax=Stakelama flava TaxID=2860338 RepID=A0ABS6XL11_9SPHN|nr:hypothetical protein [Stakelama flava]MBW4330619.1 hypothetical protein [Stakelama flava]